MSSWNTAEEANEEDFEIVHAHYKALDVFTWSNEWVNKFF